MDYTLETLKDILRRRLQDEELDGETLRIFLNDSLNEILGEDKYPFMQKIDQYSAGEEGELSLTPGYAGTLHIFANKDNQPRKELKYVSPEDFFKNGEYPTLAWTTFANTIFYRIYKDDSSDQDGFNMTHLYIVNPTPLQKDTDKVLFPPQYIEALILGAMARVEEFRDNFDYAQLYRNQQDQLLTNMKLRYGPGNLSAGNRARLPFGGGA